LHQKSFDDGRRLGNDMRLSGLEKRKVEVRDGLGGIRRKRIGIGWKM